jgi:hypothetical protein
MTNRERVIAEIEKTASDWLHQELDYYMDGDREYDYDLADALDDAYNYALREKDRKMAKEITNILISVGYLTPRTKEVVMILGRDNSPIRNGVRYDPVDSWGVWIKE